MGRHFLLLAELPEGVNEMAPFDLSHTVWIDDPVAGRIECEGKILLHDDSAEELAHTDLLTVLTGAPASR